MACGQCQSGAANVFGERAARRRLERYRAKGPGGTTRMLLDALRAEGVAGLTLLDIGGGIGAIGFELLGAGVATATEVELSPAYVLAARDEAERQGVADRYACRAGDFVALADDLPAAGIVTLDRVICRYPDMPALVGQSAVKAARLYGAAYPRDVWWVRAIRVVANVGLRVTRNPLRLFIHRTAAVEAVVRGGGLVPLFHRDAGYWQVVVYGRPT
jgi:magnesium-protoporphyrin O-methyltransferase